MPLLRHQAVEPGSARGLRPLIAALGAYALLGGLAGGTGDLDLWLVALAILICATGGSSASASRTTKRSGPEPAAARPLLQATAHDKGRRCTRPTVRRY
jgi:hypothetical protein